MFKIGHIIILKESPLTGFYFSRHIGYKQKIIRNYNGEIFTEFLEGPNKGMVFKFHADSNYGNNCMLAGFMSHNLKQFSFV